ncbi:trehalase [Pseudonocardia hierapolitana]|uniref:Trehalase n=1 Tax=Pseudonocardia hierapolitana TaxID=1128676 RepID=A0A561STF2_9PSEU|nr:trehalase family glycosidase [Pseudonocardia hierapolitana]TWF78148.1 trehalase [Pseudonocardia hierapolitana]
MRDTELRRQAIDVLRGNWERGHTVPSRRLYPHQWSWDSAFIAIGWARTSPGRGRHELESLLAAQWADGRLPQIVFNPAVARDAYFPGPDFWRSRDVPGAPRRETSGIVQPPVHAVAALEVHRASPTLGRLFLRRVYPGLKAQNDYLLRDRADGSTDARGGLVTIVHPWESGQDNSPAWDAELARVPADVQVLSAHRRRDLDHVDATERPTAADYARYVAIVDNYREHGYRDEAGAHLFVAVDPLFNALLAWSEEALAEIADIIGKPSEPHRERAAAIRDALMARCYDRAAGHFFALDRDGERVPEHCVGGLAPLVLDLPADVVDALVAGMTGPRFALNDRVPLPSYDLTGPAFDTTRYWRGPAWINTSWVVLRGLERHGRQAEAATLRAAMLNAVRQEGFREYFDPRTGAGRGVADFSWSAALTLDLLATGAAPAPAPRPLTGAPS